MNTELMSSSIRRELWKSSSGYPTDAGFERGKSKGWKAIAESQARGGENVSWGRGSGRQTLDEGQAGHGGAEEEE